MKKNTVVVLSIIVGVVAAIAATFVVLDYFGKRKQKLKDTNFVFENDFEDEDEIEA